MHPLLTSRRDWRFPIAIVGTAVLVSMAVASIRAPAAYAADADTPVLLGTTSQFAVLAGAGITNTGSTTIQGDIGSFPTTDQTIPDVTLDGTNHAGNEVTQQAKDDLVVAYDEAAALFRPPSSRPSWGARRWSGGVYKAATELGLTGTLTLDGGRSDGLPSNKVFIFQAGTTLITEVNSRGRSHRRRPGVQHLLAGRFGGDIQDRNGLPRHRDGLHRGDHRPAGCDVRRAPARA